MFGPKCAIRPDIALSVRTFPCTFPSSSNNSNQDLICAVRLLRSKYSAIILASGISTFFKVPSSTIG